MKLMKLRTLSSTLSMALIIVAPAKGLAQEAEPPAGEKVSSETEQGATELPEMTVTASPLDDTSYNVFNATTATKTDTPIMETPVSIQVVPRQVLKDQQVFRLDKALQNVSGVYANPYAGSSGSSDDFTVRGFRTQDIYRNGMRFPGGTGPLDTGSLERIEVLKGPASILYGRLEPGGLINLVPKEPLSNAYYSLQQQFGSFDFYRTNVDATGPITKNDTLLYRLNLAYETANSFREFVENERVLAAPVVRWNIDDKTQATFELTYKHSRDPSLDGVPAIGDRPVRLPRERNLGEHNSEVESDDILAGFNWSHAFNQYWTVRHRFYADISDNDLTQVFGVDLDTTNGTLARNFLRQKAHQQIYYTTLDLTGHFDTGGLEHTVLIGGDYYDFQLQSPATQFNFPSINIFNPVHRNSPGAPVVRVKLDNTQAWYGFYVQDQVRLPYHVQLLGGFRYDNSRAQNRTSGDIATNDQLEEDAVNPRFGLLWQPVPQLSLYGNFVKNFGTTNLQNVVEGTGAGVGGAALKPETAQQWELGVKSERFDGRLTSTLAYYELTKQNIISPTLNPFVFNVTGEARNRGVELDIAGEVLPGWKWIATGAYIDSKITEDTGQDFDDEGNVIGTNLGNTGHRFFNVPRFGGSLWTSFEPQGGAWQGLKLGAGVVARGEREGNNENNFQLPGYATVNLLAGYTWKVGPSKLTSQLNLDNLTDKSYFAGSDGQRLNAYFGAPRTFLGSVQVEW